MYFKSMAERRCINNRFHCRRVALLLLLLLLLNLVLLEAHRRKKCLKLEKEVKVHATCRSVGTPFDREDKVSELWGHVQLLEDSVHVARRAQVFEPEGATLPTAAFI